MGTSCTILQSKSSWITLLECLLIEKRWQKKWEKHNVAFLFMRKWCSWTSSGNYWMQEIRETKTGREKRSWLLTRNTLVWWYTVKIRHLSVYHWSFTWNMAFNYTTKPEISFSAYSMFFLGVQVLFLLSFYFCGQYLF